MPFTAQLAGLAGVPRALAQFGVAAEPLLAKVGLMPADLAADDRRVDAEIADRLLGLCVEATGCTHFGLVAGARGRGLGSAGLIGVAARHSATVGDALADLGLHRQYADPMGLLACEVHGRDAVFSYALQAPALRHADQFYDLLLALMHNAMRELCGPAWQPQIVYVPRRRPRDLQPYRAALGPRLKFDAVRAALVFPAADLGTRIPGHDPVRRREALERARFAAHKREPLLLADVRRAIRASMHSGRCSRADVARRLGLHERSLCRRLNACGTTFQDLLDETRMGIARELLCYTRLSIGRIATALGYQDSTVFGRAFRRWAGARPTDVRAAALPRNSSPSSTPSVSIDAAALAAQTA